MFVYSVKKPCNTSPYYWKFKVFFRVQVQRKKEMVITYSQSNVTLLLFLQSYHLPKQTCSWQLWHLKLIFQYGLFTINMFPQLWGNLNAEFSVSSIWVHSTDSSSIGIGEIVEIPPVRNTQLILKVQLCWTTKNNFGSQDNFYTEFQGAWTIKCFVLFLKEWREKE